MRSVPRRAFLAGASAATLLGRGRDALAKTKPTLTIAEWGGPTLTAIRSVQHFQDVANVRWVLYAGGAVTILAKIRATWPHVDYDVVANYSPVFVSMIREGWLETVTVKEMPNLSGIPDSLFMRDAAGNINAIPCELNPHMWGFRPDISPFPITRIEDLLDRRLRGKVQFPAPILNSGTQMISLARAFGGSEVAMEPAWDFVKLLALSGNIGRVPSSDTEVDNSFSSGETCVGYGAASHFIRLAADGLSIKPLAKMPAWSGLPVAMVMQGWCVLKGGKTALAKAWVNDMIAPEPDGIYAASKGSIPANAGSPVSKAAEPVHYTAEELTRYTYTPNWSVVSKELPSWVRRWEREITPLL